MSVVKDLAASVQLCFELHQTVTSPEQALNRRDAGFIGDTAGSLQPVLSRLQKAALQSDDVATDQQLLAAIASVHSSLQGLQDAACRCRIRHWLMRVLSARDVRHQLTVAFKAAAAALQELVKAAESDVTGLAALLPDSQYRQLCQLQQDVTDHKVTRHENLEGLARGLTKHMVDERTDADQLPSMLKFVVREAQTLNNAHQQHSGPSSRPDGAGSSSAAAADGAGSSSSSRAARDQLLPAGEASLTDSQLLMEVEQLAASKSSEEQVALYQVLTILEELQDAKRQKQRDHRRIKHVRRQQQTQQQLQRVPEADDDGLTIAAVHGHHTAAVSDQAAQTGRDSGSTAAAAAAAANGSNNAAAAGSTGNGGGVQFSEVVGAMMTQLEDMLARDTYDAAALTQLMELLLQVEEAGGREEEEDEAEQQVNNTNIRAETQQANQQQQQQQQSGAKKGKWWQGAKAALQSRLAAAGNSSSSSNTSQQQQHQQPAANLEQQQMLQQQRQALRERVHTVAVAALDVLLHLTPRPANSVSFLERCAMDGMCTEAGHSLVLPLMAHTDTVPALAACLYSGWTDVGSKAGQLLATLIESGSAVAAAGAVAGFEDGAASTYASFCREVCASGSSSSAAAAAVGSVGGAAPAAAPNGGKGSVWYGLVYLLHSDSSHSAGAAAEALAAMGWNASLRELCTNFAAKQQASQLLLLLTRYQQHHGAAGAAAAALHSLSEPELRPAMHRLLASSYWDQLPGTAGTLGSLLVQVMGGSDALAAARAALLAASLAGSASWAGQGRMWLRTFKAGQQLLALRDSKGSSRSAGGSSSVCSSSSSRACGALLLAQLVGEGGSAPTGPAGLDRDALEAMQQQHKLSPMLAAQVDVGLREELLFETLQMCVQQFSLSGTWTGLDELYYQDAGSSSGGSGVCTSSSLSEISEGLAAVLLLGALLRWLPVEAWCGMPELFGVALPVLDHLAATQQGRLRQEAKQVQELLLGLAG